MRLSRNCRTIFALAIAFVACGLSFAQEAPPGQKKQPEIYIVRPTGEREQRVVVPAMPPAPAQQPSNSRPPASLPSRVVPAAREKSATPAETTAWIRQLDATEFDTRETAMLRLLEEGPAVLPVLKPLFKKGSLEATTRGLFVVRQLGLISELDGDDESGRLLTELSEQKESASLARRAAATLAELTQQRSLHALTALENLGAKITPSVLDVNNPQDGRVVSIEIGNDFRGETADLKWLKWIIESPILILSGKRVSDEWVKLALVMPGLEELHLYGAKISDGGLAPLANHAALKQVGIYHTPVHDAVIEPLTKLPLLSFIKLYGTQVSKEAVDKFKEASGIAVDFRRGAFLGVGGLDLEGTCLIQTVHPGSPADKAGLQQNDIIVSFGGAKVISFGKLTELIAPHQPGDEVEIEVVRRIFNDQGGDARKISTKVTLAGWEAEAAVRNTRR
ncbi:MAG TPA: PDZ domain-containing protein [Pirellulaceae bacterium]|jgi:hypothetical protein